MIPASHMKLADIALGRPIEEFIAERRQAGKAWRLIALDLYEATDGQIQITEQSLREWFKAAQEQGAA